MSVQPLHLPAFCQALPKVELHAHINGSMSPTTMETLRQRKLAQHPELADMIIRTDCSHESFTIASFFPLFKYIYLLTDDESAVAYATRSILEDFQAENTRYIELRTTPRAVETTGMTKDSYIRAILDTFDQYHWDNRPLLARLILSVSRTDTLAAANETVDLALKYRDRGIVGVDLCHDPERGDVSVILPALRRAQAAGLPLTLHLGEIAAGLREEPLLLLDPHHSPPARLGHATFLSAEARTLLRSRQIPVEVCLTSNILTKVVSSYDTHYVQDFRRDGIPFVPCTDDKGVFCCSLSHEYERLAQVLQLSERELFDISLKSIDYIFDPTGEVKDQLKAAWNEWADANPF
ncbi:hypothetical protein H4R33_004557 [Dimargaris cristalligena]|uniref:Adenosine deaminase domain-containing protein n=1 Tax=Dimargaris cristalligena TaxID=215637 RepID=A0A4Q0A051_9FUNG|nr:hypothetical protein H4R33_004557 [Dimargaris cristalligena]RKP38622.1 hypothetical protein BJ085DRAFT_42336 [Dimargaris cristalligena]|eukprot:RKP38622.1 hypothetical protein BJ085DRAFT_42336 [Dimargaris cristalligena]